MMGDVLPYFRSRMKVLGRTEWDDPDFETVPKPRLSTAFHLIADNTIQGVSNNQDSQNINCPITLRIFFAPGLKGTRIRDEAMQYADVVLTDLLKAKNRLNWTGVKNVLFKTLRVEPLAESNDNGVILNFEFTAVVMISTV